MASLFNPDFRDFIEELNRAEVRYMLLGGYAVVLYGYDRTTGDMDVWVEATSENYTRLAGAFRHFGMPVFDMTETRFLGEADDVFTFGVPPTSIELLTAPKGVDFSDCYDRSAWIEHEGLRLRLIAKADLFVAKRAAGRARDLDDLEQLGEP